MKTPPPINMPEGGTPAGRLDMAFRKVLTVPKEAILKEEKQDKRAREKEKTSAERPHSAFPRDGACRLYEDIP